MLLFPRIQIQFFSTGLGRDCLSPVLVRFVWLEGKVIGFAESKKHLNGQQNLDTRTQQCHWPTVREPLVIGAQPPPFNSLCRKKRDMSRLQTDLIVVSQYLKGDCKKDGEGLLTKAHSDRQGRMASHLRLSKFRLEIRKIFSTVQVMRHWIRLSRKVLDAPSL